MIHHAQFDRKPDGRGRSDKAEVRECLEIRQLRFFVSLAEELHFGCFAELQHIAQSAVSELMRRLEQDLGVKLFERSSRHVRLTPAGRALLPEVRTVLKQLDVIEAMAQNWAKGSAA